MTDIHTLTDIAPLELFSEFGGVGQAAFLNTIKNLLGAQANQHKIHNSGYIFWPDGTSQAAMATNGYPCDRVQVLHSSDAVVTISQSTDVPTFAQAGVILPYSFYIDVTTADASIGASQYYTFAHKIQGFDFAPLAQFAFTVSFWVKATVTGIYSVNFCNSTGDKSYFGEYTVNVTNTWEYKTITVLASPSAGTWDYTTGVGLWIIFSLAAGSSVATAAGSWGNSFLRGSTSQVNALSSTSNDFKICGLTITKGANAALWLPESYITERERMKAFYEVLVGTVANQPFGAGQWISTTQAIIHVPFVEKRTTPTITISTAGDFDLTKSDGNNQACTAMSFPYIGVKSALALVTVAANGVAGDGTTLIAHNTDARVKVAARL